ncbi:uncharacterized protein [Trachinotus anak]|uniref:uncharacterized protein n=1 Tax=Trachinotus anak TaxID=443729 RepID=UPI0039F1BAE8
MSQTVDVTTEPLKWPIAPDGYIPNSVIRSWRGKGRGLGQTDCWDDVIFYSLHQDSTSDEEDDSTRVFWFIQDEEEDEEEEEEMYEVKRRRREKQDGINKKEEDKSDVKRKEDKNTEREVEKNEKENKKKMEVEGKEVVDERRDKMDRSDLKPSYDFQTKTHLNQLKTFDDRKIKPQRQEAGLTYSSRDANFLPPSSHENGPEPMIDLREDMKLCEAVTPPLQYLSNTQRPMSFIPEERPKPPVESPVVSAHTFIPKQGTFSIAEEPRFRTYLPTTEPQNWTSQPQKPTPSIPEDPQPQPDLAPPECLPVKDKRFLLSSAKYNNIRDQERLPLDRKVIELYKKFRVGNKNLSGHGKISTTAGHSRASRANTGGLNSGLSNSPAFKTKQSNIQTQPCRIIHPECPSHPLCSDPAQFSQTINSIKDQRGHKPMPEWRKNLYKLISVQGFRSPRAARRATTEHPVKPSNAGQLAASIPSIQPGQGAAHQRVVQKIQLKDPPELASPNFHHVIPMASQHSFFTSDPCGKTQYGRLQFDWMRGHD